MRFQNVIICDDIRTEDNGKQILIGVYAENIKVDRFPANIKLSVWAQLFADRDGTVPVEFRIRLDRDELVRAGGEMPISDHTAVATMSFPGVPLLVHNSGTLKFEMRETNKRWKLIREMVITLQEK